MDFSKILFFISLVLVAQSSATLTDFLSNVVDKVNIVTTNITQTIAAYLVKTTVNVLDNVSSNNLYDDILPDADKSYDFIIVGAGTAGSVLANRLSEIQNWNILLLEYGKEAPPLAEVPLALAALQYSNLDYNYKAEFNSTYCGACVNERMHLARGKALGGSSAINYMIHTRGNKEDFDNWAELGNDGWSYEDVLPYFKKSENATGVSMKDDGYHGTDGYVNITDIPYRTGISQAFVNASQEAGYKYVDYNGAQQLGVSWIQAALRDGRRCSEEKAYLRPVRKNPNLDIIINARVSKVLIDDSNKAYGVQFTKVGVEYTINATREVILSAGSFNSPQILMLSGIGPKDDLEELDIKVKKSLPVGQTMYDHLVYTGLVFKINDSQGLQRNDFFWPSTYQDFLRNGRGPLTSLATSSAFCYIHTNKTRTPKEYPDTEIIMNDGTFGLDFGLIYKNIYSISSKMYTEYFQKLQFTNGFQLAPMSAHPDSVGYLKLQSNSIEDPPLIYPNYFSDDSDVDKFLAAIREAQRIVKQPSFQKYNATLLDVPVPGCEMPVFDSDDYWVCSIHQLAITTHHHIATCKMGLETDPKAVVNNKLLVHGVKHLRVVDASVMPSTIVAHTNAATIMIAEKASDLIKEEWGTKP